MPYRLATLTTGWALCLLDVAAMVVVWPAMCLLVMNSQGQPVVHAWAVALLYPIANLVFLYGLGLYRRDVGVEVRKSLARLPLVAAAGALTVGAGLAALDGLTVQRAARGDVVCRPQAGTP